VTLTSLIVLGLPFASFAAIALVRPLRRAGRVAGWLSIGAIDVVELNEAFAAQALACLRLAQFLIARLHRLDLYHVVWEVTRQVRTFRPHILVTFGSEGALTAHPDHSMVSVFATLAFQWAGRNNRYPDQFHNGLGPHRTQKLYYGTAEFSLPDRQPVALAPISTVVEFAKQHLETKVAAFHAHQTQAPLFPIFENTVRRQGSKEAFHLIAQATPGVAHTENDLFEGVQEEA